MNEYYVEEFLEAGLTCTIVTERAKKGISAHKICLIFELQFTISLNISRLA